MKNRLTNNTAVWARRLNHNTSKLFLEEEVEKKLTESAKEAGYARPGREAAIFLVARKELQKDHPRKVAGGLAMMVAKTVYSVAYENTPLDPGLRFRDTPGMTLEYMATIKELSNRLLKARDKEVRERTRKAG